MGRSAKLFKRSKPASKPSTSATAHPTPLTSQPAKHKPAPPSAAAKRRTDLKQKASSKGGQSKRAPGEHVLGDVDYVSLLMGGRRKAKEEEIKMQEL
ncbi:hypothetical protein BOTBODRAFT_62016 [Botryobasidium botryosum FD-172 SS1]|uniref:Uncharacterized protein n=1 Tax=Botryobasidium botryosum (strain FD-172 SS1) TaxID=930990 RepID=A0A067MZB9_BOTB1|nr:hypothetical protein BOTBODRAFT_62016 [Botryobasidium botryosum FD-172 SS1]